MSSQKAIHLIFLYKMYSDVENSENRKYFQPWFFLLIFFLSFFNLGTHNVYLCIEDNAVSYFIVIFKIFVL